VTVLLAAIREVESKGNDHAVGDHGHARGPFQIHRAYWIDGGGSPGAYLRDVWDPAAVEGSTHVTRPEREALESLEDWGLVDVFRLHYPQPQLFTWWDYRAGNFHKHIGMRIDLVLLSRPLADRSTYALVDRNARKGKLPSDHAPLFVDIGP